MKCYLRPEARQELNDATMYYEELREDFGGEFLEEFLVGITEIEEAPIRWPLTHPGIRRFRISRFPYAIVYQVIGEYVDVIAIAHQARREGYWLDRL